MQTNWIRLIGYVGNHLQSQTTKNGHRKTSLRVATHYAEKQKDGSTIYHTVWHDVVAWGKTAEHIERNVVKGSRVLIEGSLHYHTFPDSTGHIRYMTDIKASSLINLDR